MKAFWWFRDGAVAGMARPGFNAVCWYELPFEEAILLGWLGRHSSGKVSLQSFRDHLHTYAPRVFRFHGHDDISGRRAIAVFDDPVALQRIGESLRQRTRAFQTIDVADEHLRMTISESHLRSEIDDLRARGITTIVSLTEQHHQNEILKNHFQTHHIGIADLEAPQIDQVRQLAAVIDDCRRKNEVLAVHCLAGIGRTSTMLIAAHLVLGENSGDLKKLIARQNPSFVFAGAQAKLIEQVAADYEVVTE